MQNPIGEADLEWILHRNCEGTDQLRYYLRRKNNFRTLRTSYFQDEKGNGCEAKSKDGNNSI